MHGVTLRQKLTYPEISSTSNYSSSAIAIRHVADVDAVESPGRDLLRQHEHAGAGPGLCVIWRGDVADCDEALRAIKTAAQRRLVAMREAQSLVRRIQIRLKKSARAGRAPLEHWETPPCAEAEMRGMRHAA